MNTKTILEWLVSDVLLAGLISGIFTYISNKHSDKATQDQARMFELLKEHIEQRLKMTELEIKNEINKKPLD
jgi:hypothetical protein